MTDTSSYTDGTKLFKLGGGQFLQTIIMGVGGGVGGGGGWGVI